MLFSRYKTAYERKRKIMRNVASIAELKKSFFAGIDQVENRGDLEKLRVKYLGRENRILTAVLRSLGGMPRAKRKELRPQAQELKREGDPSKLALAARLRKETTLSIRPLANRPHAGSWKHLNAKLHRGRKANEKDPQ
jgi:phenylalanyl-tRNA synthetase alpha subunit